MQKRVDYDFIQFSIAVVGQNHNPSIINRDFLNIRNIVPLGWDWDVNDDQMIVTPLLAQVSYKNGVAIRVEPNKATFVDSTGAIPLDSKIPTIASVFVDTLMHVKYTAMGFNFRCIVLKPDPDTYLKSRFLKTKDLVHEDQAVRSVGLRFVYDIPGGRMNLHLDPGIAERKDDDASKKNPVILILCNCHRDLTDYPANTQIYKSLKDLGSDWTQFNQLINHLIT